MNISKCVFSTACGLFATCVFADVPVIFQSGTTAQASQVNQDFENLDGRLEASLGALIVSQITGSRTSAASASCPVDKVVVSANCECDDVNGTRNFGMLFACTLAGNGGVVGCFDEAITYDPLKLSPLATVTVACLSGRANDGTPLPPTVVPLSVDSSNPQASITSADPSAPRKSVSAVPNSSTEQEDELNAVLKAMQDQVAAHTDRLQNR